MELILHCCGKSVTITKAKYAEQSGQTELVNSSLNFKIYSNAYHSSAF